MRGDKHWPRVPVEMHEPRTWTSDHPWAWTILWFAVFGVMALVAAWMGGE